jgi:hypothetical protein
LPVANNKNKSPTPGILPNGEGRQLSLQKR